MANFTDFFDFRLEAESTIILPIFHLNIILAHKFQLFQEKLLIFYQFQQWLLFSTELSTFVVQKCHLLKTKAKKRHFWKTNVQ